MSTSVSEDAIWEAASKALEEPFKRHNGADFLSPRVLSISDVKPRRVLFTGSCAAAELGFHVVNVDSVPVDFVLANSLHTFTPPHPASAYDLQLIQIAFRDILPEGVWWEVPYEDVTAHERLLDRCTEALKKFIDARAKLNAECSLLTFVFNFTLPQANEMGRLMPKFDLRNPYYFVLKLNEALERLCRTRQNLYVLDLDAITASIGRRYVQDDVVHWLSHSGNLGNADRSRDRIEPVLPMAQHFIRRVDEASAAIWNEIIAMHRTVRQSDAVKLVVVDLDDTLWKGVAAEMDYVDASIAEGWPLGVVEALVYLKKRGILLAMVSKNDEERVKRIWDTVYGRRFPLSWFVISKINWRPKAENMREILAETNLLPKSVVYVDDHPAERAAMAEAFPDMRILDGHHYYWRKTLLWSPETQVPFVSAVSARRTEMVQAKLTRLEAVRAAQEHGGAVDDGLEVHVEEIDLAHPAFGRAFELLNKTNQFNTTGKRWTIEEMSELFRSGGSCYVFAATDRFTPYGIIGVVLTLGSIIRQVVMSCRVLGRGVEHAALSKIIERLGIFGVVVADTKETEANGPSRDLFHRLGFERQNERWSFNGSLAPAEIYVPCSCKFREISLVAS